MQCATSELLGCTLILLFSADDPSDRIGSAERVCRRKLGKRVWCRALRAR